LAAFFLADSLVGFFLPALFADAVAVAPRSPGAFLAADLRAGRRVVRPVAFFFLWPAACFAARLRRGFLTLAIA
jgi:hypothetical protein